MTDFRNDETHVFDKLREPAPSTLVPHHTHEACDAHKAQKEDMPLPLQWTMGAVIVIAALSCGGSFLLWVGKVAGIWG